MIVLLERLRSEPGGSWRFPSARLAVIKMYMPASTPDNKKSMGRPRTGIGQLIGVRLQPEQLSALDHWIAAQDNPLSRPEAIRMIIKEKLL